MINTAREKLIKNKTKKENYEWNTTALTILLFKFGLEVVTSAIRQVTEINKGFKGDEIIMICRLIIVYLGKLRKSTERLLETRKEFGMLINHKMKKSRAFLNSVIGRIF